MFSFMNILAKISKTENYTNWLLITGDLSLKLFIFSFQESSQI